MNTPRSGRLVAVAVIAIALGGLGILSGLGTIASAAMQGSITQLQQGMLSGLPGEQAEAQGAMQARIQEVVHAWLPYTVTVAVLNLVAAGLLVTAGILLLRSALRAPRLFRAAVAGNVFVDVTHAIVTVVIQRQTFAAMGDFGALAGGHTGPEVDRIMQATMKATSWLGACFAGVWLLLKLGFYVFGVLSLRRPEVQRVFAPQPPAPEGFAPPPE